MPRNIYGATKAAAEDLCELVAPRPRAARPDPAHLALLPRARRPRRRPRARTTTRTSRSTSCSTAASTSRTSSSAHLLALERAPDDRLRPLHHQRDDAVHPPTTSPRSRDDAPAVVRAPLPRLRGDVRRARLAHVPDASSACTSTSGRAATSAGRRATTSAARSTGSPTGEIRAARWPEPSARRATTRPRPASTPSAEPRSRVREPKRADLR